MLDSFFTYCGLHKVSSGADPGEVKWVDFHPPFSVPPSFFFFSQTPQPGFGSIKLLQNSPPISKSWIRPCSYIKSMLDSFFTYCGLHKVYVRQLFYLLWLT